MDQIHVASNQNIGILYSPRSKCTAEAIKSAADQKGLNAILILTQTQNFPDALEA